MPTQKTVNFESLEAAHASVKDCREGLESLGIEMAKDSLDLTNLLYRAQGQFAAMQRALQEANGSLAQAWDLVRQLESRLPPGRGTVGYLHDLSLVEKSLNALG